MLIFPQAQAENSNELFQKLLEDLKELAEYNNSPKLLCIHDNVEDLIESALNSKLISINSNSQPLNKKEQEVKNVVEQPAERRTRVEKSLQNFRVIHKSSISLNNTSQISPVHAVARILSTEEPEHSLSMGYEHLSITPETKSDEVIEFNAKNLLPIPSECEVTSEDESKCDMPAKDDCSLAFTTFSNPLFNNNEDLDSSDNESLPEEDVLVEEFKVYSNRLFDDDEINFDKLDSDYFNVESDFVESLLNHDTFSSKFDFFGELAHVNPENTESNFDFEEEIHLMENFRMEMLFTINPRPRPTVNVNAIIESLSSLPILVQDGDSQRKEIDIVTETDDVLPPSVENNDESEGEIEVVEELLSDNYIPLTEDEALDFDYQDDPSFPRPLPKPPDVEFDFKPDSEEEILIVVNNKDKFDDDYSPFIFVIQYFLPFLICSKMFLSFLSAESEDTIFDP
nr:hypothetical protein [Tanacetum cinerariifolium]